MAGVVIRRYGETADFDAWLRADKFGIEGDRDW
jgi:hypothetical protein